MKHASVELTVAALGAALGTAAVPATIDSLEITRKHGRFEISADTYLDAPANGIFDVLLDYDDNGFHRISSVYKESTYLDPAPDGTPMIYTRMEGCILFFCKSMRRVERLETMAPTSIRTYTVPEKSDFTYSYTEWQLEPEGNGTRMKYLLIMEPNFWVPPIVGPWFLKRALEVGGLHAVRRIERMAQREQIPRRLASSD